MATHNSKVAFYYDFTTPFYKLFWHGTTGAIHYGLADETTNGLADELLNTNRFLSEKANIGKGDKILDAGCGVGGSSIWLRKNFDVDVTGITLSSKQVEVARKTAKGEALNNVKFEVRDFIDTKFPDESFDVVWAIESICHAENKREFLREAFRLLRPGGRVIVADGFLLRDPTTKQEKKWLEQVLQGLILPDLSHMIKFRDDMNRVGFSQIEHWDKTQNALPSAKRLYRMCRIGYPISKITEKLHITPSLLTANNLAGMAQYKIVKSGLAGYGVFFGVKDKSAENQNER